MEIKGKTAVVTGGGSGIGRATAVRLAAEGAAVLAADLDEAGMRETVRLIESAGGRAAAVRADVALARGVNVVDGTVVYGPVAQAHDLPWRELDEVLG